MSQFAKKKKVRKVEVLFDPDARRDHLQGFSERKRQRRAFGLAMQKVKDRKARIEQRKQDKKDGMEKIEEAERQKEVLLEDQLLNSGVLKDDVDTDTEGDVDDSKGDKNNEKDKEVAAISERKYDNAQAESKWGGSVTVTTSFVSLEDLSDDDDDDDDDDIRESARSKKPVDKQQRSAGDVKKYLNEFKAKMPGKKKDGRQVMKKGNNGASEMRGMGGSKNLKDAQKVLGRAKALKKTADAPHKKGKGKKPRR
jgi:ribosomal RNA-processing protein 17